MRKLFVIIVCLLAAATVYGQSVKELVAEGDRLHSKKKYKDAIAVFKKALDINPDDASVNFKLGLAYLYSDTKSKAAGFIDKAYRLNPKIDNRIDYHLGTAFQNRNEFKQAIDHFKAFGENNPNLSSIAADRTRLLFRQMETRSSLLPIVVNPLKGNHTMKIFT